MDSQKSTQKPTPPPGEAKAPRRARGHARVATLLEAASAEFADKGFEATTMTAIAARAQSSIGSLYQFFPTKEQVAATLLEQYVGELEAVLDRLREEVPSLDVAIVAGRLATLFLAFRTTHPAFVALADVPALVSAASAASAASADSAVSVEATGAAAAAGVRERMRGGIAAVLAALAPGLPAQEAWLRAVIVQHLMKAAVTLGLDATVDDPGAAMAEFQRVVQGYLEDAMAAGLAAQAGAARRGTASKGRATSGGGARRQGKTGKSA